MANADVSYISKNAAPLVNPTTQSVFLKVVPVTPNTTITPQPAYIVYKAYAAPVGAGTSNNQQIIQIIVKASGRATGGTTTNFTPSLQFIGTSATQVNAGVTAANNSTLASLTAAAFNSASGAWTITATLLYDVTSGYIIGSVNGFAGAGGTETLTSVTAITPILAGVDPATPANISGSIVNTGEIQLFFAAAGVFSASNANNVAYLDAFQVEAQ